MRSIAGSGVLITGARKAPVRYDLQESPAGHPYMAQGTVFGESGSLRPVYLSGPCRLRLENGSVAEVVLTDCNGRGVADIAVTSGLVWPA